MSKQLWDGKKRPFGEPGSCTCGGSLFMEGMIDPDGPQVYVFCDRCSFRQPMISREPLSQRDLAWGRERARLLPKPPRCCVP